MEIFLFCLTFTCITVIAFNLYVLELSDTIDLETIVALVDVSFTVASTFAYFYLSDWITGDLLAIGDTFYDSPWYHLPSSKQQCLLVVPLQRAQRVFRLKGMQLFDCSLAVFSTVDLCPLSTLF